MRTCALRSAGRSCSRSCPARQVAYTQVSTYAPPETARSSHGTSSAKSALAEPCPSRASRSPELRGAVAPQQLAHPPVRLLNQLGHDVLVPSRHRGRGPPEHVHDDALVDTLDEQERRGCVSRVVQAGRAYA